jgi:hypothetical protein
MIARGRNPQTQNVGEYYPASTTSGGLRFLVVWPGRKEIK